MKLLCHARKLGEFTQLLKLAGAFKLPQLVYANWQNQYPIAHHGSLEQPSGVGLAKAAPAMTSAATATKTRNFLSFITFLHAKGRSTQYHPNGFKEFDQVATVR